MILDHFLLIFGHQALRGKAFGSFWVIRSVIRFDPAGMFYVMLFLMFVGFFVCLLGI